MQHAIAALRMPVNHNDASRSVILAFSAVFQYVFGIFNNIAVDLSDQGNL